MTVPVSGEDQPDPSIEDPFVYARTAARAAGVHENTIRKWAKLGYIRSYPLHPTHKFHRYSLHDAEVCAMAEAAYSRAFRQSK